MKSSAWVPESLERSDWSVGTKVKCAFRKSRKFSTVVYYEGVIHCKDIVNGVDRFKVSFDDDDQQWYTTGSDDDDCIYSQNSAEVNSSNELYRMLRLFKAITWDNSLWTDVESKIVQSINIPHVPLSKDITAKYMNCLSSGVHHYDIDLKQQLLCTLDNFSKLFISKWKSYCRTKQTCDFQRTGNRLLRWSTQTQCYIRDMNTNFHLYSKAAA